MVFLGLIGMIDPPRPEAKAAIETCRRAGIKPVMITGDHPATAEAVARELGLLTTGRVVVGNEIDAMSDSDLQRQVHHIEVFARVSPAHKLRVVSAWQHQGHVVAMTGDGVARARGFIGSGTRDWGSLCISVVIIAIEQWCPRSHHPRQC